MNKFTIVLLFSNFFLTVSIFSNSSLENKDKLLFIHNHEVEQILKKQSVLKKNFAYSWKKVQEANQKTDNQLANVKKSSLEKVVFSSVNRSQKIQKEKNNFHSLSFVPNEWKLNETDWDVLSKEKILHGSRYVQLIKVQELISYQNRLILSSFTSHALSNKNGLKFVIMPFLIEKEYSDLVSKFIQNYVVTCSFYNNVFLFSEVSGAVEENNLSQEKPSISPLKGSLHTSEGEISSETQNVYIDENNQKMSEIPLPLRIVFNDMARFNTNTRFSFKINLNLSIKFSSS